MGRALTALALGLLFVFSFVYNAFCQEPGSMAPQFTLRDVNEKSVSLSDFKGKVIILDFWATWCPPCRAEIPDFITLEKQYGSKGLQIIGISVDKERGALKTFYKEKGMNYPVLFSDGNVEAKYGGIRSIPTTFIIDKKGKIVKKYIGMESKETFEKEIKPLLGQ